MIRATLSGILAGILALASLIALLEWTRIEPAVHVEMDGPPELPERWQGLTGYELSRRERGE